ncbi:hypothetical protein OUZ56_021386 [Daphnia magna]|uniref:Uncharacterized protein n=1 Tax=Daphnia magna TaxID=35525 RepID=A0ABQ9ZH76_9CRUS|nr:hypothetical protein OUZ56_021386 [Daphnia magna]
MPAGITLNESFVSVEDVAVLMHDPLPSLWLNLPIERTAEGTPFLISVVDFMGFINVIPPCKHKEMKKDFHLSLRTTCIQPKRCSNTDVRPWNGVRKNCPPATQSQELFVFLRSVSKAFKFYGTKNNNTVHKFRNTEAIEDLVLLLNNTFEVLNGRQYKDRICSGYWQQHERVFLQLLQALDDCEAHWKAAKDNGKSFLSDTSL